VGAGQTAGSAPDLHRSHRSLSCRTGL